MPKVSTMAAEPINLFSRKIDPRGVVQVLRTLAPSLQVIGLEDCWEKIIIAGSKRFFKKSPLLTFIHDPDYYDGPGWPRQVMGMQGYFSRFPGIDQRPEIMKMIGNFRFALATSFEPDLDIDSEDDRLKYIFAIARHLDGAIFTPSSLRDASGRVLIAADGEYDPQAVMPQLPSEKVIPEAEEPPAADEEDEEPLPPTAIRVAQRALALVAVSARALLEQQDAADPMVQARHQQLIDWVAAIGVGDELEPDEWKVLQRPVGSLDQQAVINATWRLEGLAVLAWALRRFEFPRYDQLVDPDRLLHSLGFLDEDAARSLLEAPELRSSAELDALRKQLLGLHWRLRNFTLRPQAMDFAKFARDAWFGPMDITPFQLVDGDLGLAGQAISKAPEEIFQRSISSAMERHQVINWLHGYSRVYSETDTST